MKRYLVTIKTLRSTITRNIIAASSIKATITALNTIPAESFGAFKITARVAL